MKLRYRIGAAILLALFVAVLSRPVWLPGLAHWLDVSHSDVPTDYGVIMPGGLETRVFAAAAMTKAGLVEKLLVIENLASPAQLDGDQIPTHELTIQVLLARGVRPDQLIALPGESTTTTSDLQIVGEFLRDKPNAKVAMITSPFHTRRTRFTVRRVLGEQAQQFRYLPIPEDTFVTDQWWRSEVGARLIVTEYFKLAYYRAEATTTTQRLVAGACMLLIGAALVRKRWKARRSNGDLTKAVAV